MALAAFAGFVALGTWQIERRAWKRDLMARIDARVHAAPTTTFAPDDEYRRVRVTGTFLHDRETLVQAVTVLGSGFWVLTPLQQADGRIVLVNRGFVPPEARERAARAAGEVQSETSVTGLLRLTEPGGGFLRHNDPAGERWYSRDVRAIAVARGLAQVAPFFVDADGGAAAPGAQQHSWPAGGLTVIAFRDNHLAYALTWYVLALMVAAAGGWLLYRGKRQERRDDTPSSD